ncbi:MAG TPA: efflux RND transporter periplasmic adaptor subunit, partial [Verrucomicrobiae bacterium]|nr:efflux RND transporter periplasmic adaptor subunit [Verrucomicrobiae bacterium]
RITSPIAGRVGLRLVDAGNMVRANDPNGLLVITQLQPIAVLFTIPEDSLPPLLRKIRERADLPVDAFDRDGSARIATGRLLTADNQIDPATGTSKLKAIFDNADGALFPNQFVNVRLRLDVDAGAIIVPVVSVQRGPKGAFVYVVGAGSLAEVRPVTLGPTSANDVAIRSGVGEGDDVVVDGMDKLRAGSPVRAAASPEPGANG